MSLSTVLEDGHMSKTRRIDGLAKGRNVDDRPIQMGGHDQRGLETEAPRPRRECT